MISKGYKSVVHVTEATGAGVLTYVTLLANAQAASGMTVIVLALGQRPDRAGGWKDGFNPRVEVDEIPSPGNLIRAILLVRRRIQEFRPDVVHLHSSIAGGIGRLAASIAYPSSRVVYQPHGLSFLRQDFTSATRLGLFLCEWLLARLPCALVSVCEGEHAQMNRLGRKDLHLVENGVELSDIIASRPYRVDPGRIRIGTAGRICQQKDPRLFSEIAASLGTDLFDWIWIGDGDEALKRDLRFHGVTVTGWATRNDALARVADLDIFLQTSLWEGMPLSLIEAQLSGVPAVVRDVIGNRDIIRRTEGGIMFSDLNQAKSALKELAGSALLRERLASNARTRSACAFSFSRIPGEIQNVYAADASTSATGGNEQRGT